VRSRFCFGGIGVHAGGLQRLPRRLARGRHAGGQLVGDAQNARRRRRGLFDALRNIDVLDLAGDRHPALHHMHGHAVGHVAAAEFGDASAHALAQQFIFLVGAVTAVRFAFRLHGGPCLVGDGTRRQSRARNAGETQSSCPPWRPGSGSLLVKTTCHGAG
jgi:hypothetical protein